MKKQLLFLVLCVLVGTASAATFVQPLKHVNVCYGDTLHLYAYNTIDNGGSFSDTAHYLWKKANNVFSYNYTIDNYSTTLAYGDQGCQSPHFSQGPVNFGSGVDHVGTYDNRVFLLEIRDGGNLIKEYFMIHVKTSQTTVIADTICDSFTWINGVTYNSSNNTDFVKLMTVYGCDSIVRLNLTINYSSSSDTIIRNSCDQYTWDWNGQVYTKSGTYTYKDTNIYGCDSLGTLNLTIKNSKSADIFIDTCVNYNASFSYGGTSYNSSGDYEKVTTRTFVNGCDSTTRLHLNIRRNSSQISIDTVSACDSFYFAGRYYKTTGTHTYSDTLTNANGCDSIIGIRLTVNPSINTVIDTTVCERFMWNASNYTTSGRYTHNSTINGCPKRETLFLHVNYPSTKDTMVNGCDMISATWGNTEYVYTDSGYYSYTLGTSFPDQHGCDSIVRVNVQVRKRSTHTVDTSACDSFYYAWFGQQYFASTTDSLTFTNAVGCDSVVTLNLIIRYSTNTLEDTAACDSYSWNGQTYTVSGTFRLSDTNTAGCDSNQTLVLTIRHPLHTVSYVAECKSYSWYGTDYTEDTIAVHTYYTDDSVCLNADTLHLTIYGVEIPAVKTLVRKGNRTSPWMLIYPRSPNERDYRYQWYRNGSPLDGATKQYYVLPNEDATEDIVYSILVADTNVLMCAAESRDTLRHSGFDAANNMSVYPNPSRGHFSLHLTGEETEGVAQVLTQAGVEVLRFEVRDGWASVENSLPAGSYMLQVTTTKGNKLTERLVIIDF